MDGPPDPPLSATDATASRLLYEHDWGGFSLGAPEDWPEGVRSAVRLCLNSSLPSAVLCGSELQLIYNDEYRRMLGEDTVDGTLGRPFRDCWPRLWPSIGDSLNSAYQQGKEADHEALEVPAGQDGKPGVRYLSLSASPVREPDGSVSGLFCVLTENTRWVISERRLNTLSSLHARSSALSGTTARICEVAAEVFATNPADLPFGVLYLLDSADRARGVSAWGSVPREVRLGETVELATSPWPLARAVRELECVAYGDATPVLVVPLVSPAEQVPIGLLVCAAQPDAQHRGFAELLAQRLGAALGAARTREKTRRGARTELPDSAELSSHSDGDDTQGARVLIADDDEQAREYLLRALGPYWTVQAVPDGRAALAAIHKDPPELVLADVTMPGLDGFELLSELRGNEETAGLPVILLSARSGEESTVRGLRAGADDYVVKPFVEGELVARVRTQLSTLRLRQRLTQRLRELADASHALTTSLNTDEICNVVADLVVPERARWCVIWLVREDEEHHPRITGHYAVPDSDSEQARRLRSAVREHCELAVHLLGADDVLYSGRLSEQVETWPAELLPLRGEDTLTLPMMARRRLVGAITFGAPQLPDRESADGAYLRELARRAALAFDNAALYEAEERIALGLQRSLLPASLPGMPGLRLAARYLPGGRGTRVGGDWYDVVELPDGRIGLSVGDVVGQGVSAAASMGQLRTALRSYALEDGQPEQVLSRVDTFQQQAGGATFATCLYGCLDAGTGNLRLANAGHLTPWLLIPGQPPQAVPIRPGVPLGGASALVDRQSPFAGHDLHLPPGGILLLYTDGLVEARWGGLDVGLDRLRGALVRDFGSPEELCEHVLAEMSVEDTSSDDVTLLVLMRE